MLQKLVIGMLVGIGVLILGSSFVSAACSDGTVEGVCSVNQPYKCVAGELVETCGECGCFESHTCQPEGACTRWASTRSWVSGNIYYSPWECGTLTYLQELDCATKGDLGLNWTFYAKNYDLIINVGEHTDYDFSVVNDIIETNNPHLLHGPYFVNHYVTYSSDNTTPSIYNYTTEYVIGQSVDPEELFLHYKTDAFHTAKYMWGSQTTHTRMIAGWNDSNDPNGDGINDYLYYNFYQATWNNDANFIYTISATGFQQIPGDQIFIRNNANVEVTGSFTITITGAQVQIQQNSGVGGGPFEIYIPYFGELQTGAPDPNAHATNKFQSRVVGVYWNNAVLTNSYGADAFFPQAFSWIYDVQDQITKDAQAAFFLEYLTRQQAKGYTHDLGFIDDANGRMPDDFCDNCITSDATIEDYQGNESYYRQQLNQAYLDIKLGLQGTAFEKFMIFPNVAGVLLGGYWPQELFTGSDGFFREWSHSITDPEFEFDLWKTNLNESKQADKWQLIHFRATAWQGLGMPPEREALWSLATYYIHKYPKLAMMYGYKGWSGYWQKAFEKDVGQPIGEDYSWKTFTDASCADALSCTSAGSFTSFSKTHTIHRRNFTKGIVFLWYKAHEDWKGWQDLFTTKTFQLDPADLNQGYCILNANGSVGECNPTEITMQQASGLILIKENNQTQSNVEVLFEDNFETGDFSKWDEIEPTMDSIESTDCPQGNYCYKRLFSPSAAYDAMNVLTSREFDQAYLSYWGKFSPNFAFGVNDAPDSGGDHYWRYYALNYGVQLDSSFDGNQNYEFLMGADTTSCTYTYDYSVDSSNYISDQWQFVEVFMKLNTQTGVNKISNGIIQVWIDGNIVLNNTHACMRDNLTSNFGRFSITNYNANSPGENGEVYIMFDDIKILSDKPSAPAPTCPLPYDTSPTCNNCIDSGELSSTITGWFNNQINIAQLVVNIKNWKNCN